MKYLLIIFVMIFAMGCGVTVHYETEGTKIDYRRDWLAPENINVTTPDGLEIAIGEQASQQAIIKAAFAAGLAATVP